MSQQDSLDDTYEKSKAKLVKIIDKKITKALIATLFDGVMMIATPAIIDDAIDEIQDEYAKDVIGTIGIILFAYEVDRGIKDFNMLKFLLEKKKNALSIERNHE